MYSMQMLVPALDALEMCWRDTDALFASIPDWSVQPISMRHPFGFYYGELQFRFQEASWSWTICVNHPCLSIALALV